ncbi:hypothetical protein [Catenuloplanes atrovinosus]|uniref:Uncharacterized protein n=1 Tax=Catenuloplanes atrovinosus TaxID=137266 RepID=A0AAE3YXN4_9ACTN|nr:hypothetical protein [Catenuloplanes atrovinosus]MDR7280682.1 hypothetical protein [Catenuloplanes atrovinosus]
MGALVTLDLPDDSPTLDLPWIITFGPLSDDDEWEPVVCGPYERQHALSLAESVVADEQLMAVVEPLLPSTAAGEIRDEIEKARRLAEEEPPQLGDESFGDAGLTGLLDEEADAHDHDHLEAEPPTPAEIKAGMRRIAAKLSA